MGTEGNLEPERLEVRSNLAESPAESLRAPWYILLGDALYVPDSLQFGEEVINGARPFSAILKEGEQESRRSGTRDRLFVLALDVDLVVSLELAGRFTLRLRPGRRPLGEIGHTGETLDRNVRVFAHRTRELSQESPEESWPFCLEAIEEGWARA